MSALNEILAWSATAPAWLRDALRRIVTGSAASESDIAELADLCKAPHGLSASTPVPGFLASHHVPESPTVGTVSISSITHISDVNALAPNETLTFAPTGLTVIYGDNGAGKSGFTRILRRACRARGGSAPILANALSDKPAGAPTARIDYALSGLPREHTWKDGAPADPELSAVSVFDTAAAQVYVEEKTDVRFRPFGLDVTDRAAGVCFRVKKTIEAEAAALRAQATVLPVLAPNTEAGRLVGALTALTSHAEVDRLGTLSANEQQELDELTAILAAARAEDPKKKAADLKLKIGRLGRLLEELHELTEKLSNAQIAALMGLARDADAATNDVRRLSHNFGEGLALPGVGGPEWSAMWEAAKAYSENKAYHKRTFPHVTDGALCVLCQQKLDAAAQVRFAQFAEFVLGTVRETARKKNDELEKARRSIVELKPGEKSTDALADLVSIDAEVATDVQGFLASAKDCQADVAAAVPEPRRCTSVCPAGKLAAVIADLKTRAEAFLNAADPAARAQSERRVAELAARKTLSSCLQSVHLEIDRRARLNAYDQCLKDTDTRALTKLGVELTKRYVTDTLTSAFASELTGLGFTAIELELKPASGQRGQLFHQIALKHATRAELPRVLSEGESRCISLAAFMAELCSASHQSSVIFDDPVSSLDHQWRGRIARRLVEAAQTRQVVVFTHELVFSAALLHEAEKAGVPAETRTLARDREFAGHVAAGLPWHGLPTRRRVGLLRERWVKAEKVFRTSGRDAYDPIATSIYADLRRTWERAIEEVLLNQVVVRFRAGIETNRLKKIGDITAEDLEAVENGMTKSSKWEGGHDQALAMNERPPPPEELKQDIDALDIWVSSIEKRMK